MNQLAASLRVPDGVALPRSDITGRAPDVKEPSQSNRRSSLLRWGRLLLGLGVLAFILSRMDLPAVVEALRQPHLTGLFVACSAQIAAKLILGLRWRDLLQALGIRRRIGDLVALVFVGFYFNLFLPSAIGGDAARGYYVARPGDRLSVSYAVLVIERFLGLLALAGVVAIAGSIALAMDPTPLAPEGLAILVGLGLLTVIAGTLVFWWRGWGTALSRLSRFGERAGRIGTALSQGLELFRRPEAKRLRIVGLSLLLQVIGVLFYFGCARTVGVQTDLLAFFLIVPASVVVSMLPITLNGLGLREGALTGLLVLYGAEPASVGAFVVVSLFVATVFSLAGGVVHLLYRTPREREDGHGTPAA